MSALYLLDTNVLLYAASQAPDHQHKRLLARQWVAREDWGVSTQVLMEYFSNAVKPRHGLGVDQARAMTRAVIDRYPVQAVDADLVEHALALSIRYQISHWDAAVIAAAQRLGAHTVVSEDLAHGQRYDGVQVLNPFA